MNNKGLTAEQMSWLDLVKTRPISFGIEAGFDLLTDLHNDWLKEFLFNPKSQTKQAHRGSYKTTVVSIAQALTIILQPNLNSMFLRKTDDDVKEIIRQVQLLLQSDPFVQLAYALYRIELKLTTATATEVTTNLRMGNRGSPQLLGIGSRGSVTGKHADIIYTDDLVNLEDRISAAERNRSKMVYQELGNVLNRGGKFINTGTPWHKDDAFQLMPNIERYSCYDTGLISDEQLQVLRDAMSPSLFAANYELKHVAEGERLFFDPQYASPQINAAYAASDNEVVAHIDASYAGADGSALSVLKVLNDGTIVVHGELKKGHIENHLRYFEAVVKRRGGNSLLMETNSDKGWLARETKLVPLPYHESTNKDVKISTYLRAQWRNIRFTRETDPEYINQILEYNKDVSHDDAPDSLATAVRYAETKKRRSPTMGYDNRQAVDFFKRMGF